MTHTSLSKELLETKIEDFRLNSGLMPKKAWMLSKIFASTLGQSAGKAVSAYDKMLSGLEQGQSLEQVREAVRNEVNSQSKVKLKVLNKPIKARICGLVAMNYSGFLDSEVELYSALKQDMESQAGSGDISDLTRQAAMQNPEKYSKLLEQKKQSIYDFSILMGLVDDQARLATLKENMPGGIAKYFDKVIAMHKGSLGLSWPLPIKRFSTSIQKGLSRDTISYAAQEGVGEDYGFEVPEKAQYEQVVDLVKDTAATVKDKDLNFRQKWKIASALPASVFFLTGLNAYAQSDDAKEAAKSNLDNGIAAATTAGLCASTSADDGDRDSFVTSFLTFWTTTYNGGK